MARSRRAAKSAPRGPGHPVRWRSSRALDVSVRPLCQGVPPSRSPKRRSPMRCVTAAAARAGRASRASSPGGRSRAAHRDARSVERFAARAEAMLASSIDQALWQCERCAVAAFEEFIWEHRGDEAGALAAATARCGRGGDAAPRGCVFRRTRRPARDDAPRRITVPSVYFSEGGVVAGASPVRRSVLREVIPAVERVPWTPSSTGRRASSLSSIRRRRWQRHSSRSCLSKAIQSWLAW